MEEGESERETAEREIKEETKLEDLEFIEGFRETTDWYYRWEDETIYKIAVYFLVEVGEKDVEISHEHLEYKWLEYEKVMETLTYDNTKEVFEKAHRFLQES